MITFEVVKEPYGWAVRQADCMMMPACSRAVALEQAVRMVAALRGLGQAAELRVEDPLAIRPPETRSW